MSDLVKEAAQSLGPTIDSSNQAINKRKLLALSSRGTSAGGFAGNQASFLVDAFAEVFASQAISKPAPLENSISASKARQAREERAAESGRSNESGQDNLEPSAVDNSDRGSEAAVSVEFALQAQVDHRGESAEDTGEIPILEATDESDLSDQTSDFEVEDESIEASQLAVAATISQSADEVKLGSPNGDQATTHDDAGDSQTAVAPVKTESSEPAVQQAGDADAINADSDDSAGLQTDGRAGDQDDQQSSEQNGRHHSDPAESGDRRRYSKDGGPSSERPAIAASENSASQAASTTSDQQQNSKTASNLAPSSPAAGNRPAVPPPTAAANATAAAAVSSVSNASGAALSAASRGAASSSGITSSVNSAEGSQALTGTEQSGHPKLATKSSSAKKADTSTNQAETLNRIKLVQRVSRAFQHLGPEGGVVRLRLAPVELGTVRVEMQIQQKKVNARVVAETEAASNALREHLPELKARLEEHGMQIESLEVETQPDDNASSTSDHRSHQETNRHRASRSNEKQTLQNRDDEKPIVAQVSQQPISLSSSGGVDIRF